MTVLFWLTLVAVLIPLGGYALFWRLLAALRPARPQPDPVPQDAVVLIVAHNAADRIAPALASVLSQDTGAHRIEVLVVSDGSEDGTVEVAETAAAGDPRLRTLSLPVRAGRAAALNRGLSGIPADWVVVLADPGSRLCPGALAELLAPFAESSVGGVAGQRSEARHEGALLRAEDRLGGVTCLRGPLLAVRRGLVPRLSAARPGAPARECGDDRAEETADALAISLAVASAGRRLAFAPGARVTGAKDPDGNGTFAGRVCAAGRGWRALLRNVPLMNPRRSGLYAPQLACGLLLPALLPVLLPLLCLASLATAGQGGVPALALAAQGLVYGAALLAAVLPGARRLPGLSAALRFVVGQAATGRALLRWGAGAPAAGWTPADSRA